MQGSSSRRADSRAEGVGVCKESTCTAGAACAAAAYLGTWEGACLVTGRETKASRHADQCLTQTARWLLCTHAQPASAPRLLLHPSHLLLVRCILCCYPTFRMAQLLLLLLLTDHVQHAPHNVANSQLCKRWTVQSQLLRHRCAHGSRCCARDQLPGNNPPALLLCLPTERKNCRCCCPECTPQHCCCKHQCLIFSRDM